MTPHDSCPDAETLAAWYDEGLTPSEHASIDAHVSACDRCQALAAALVRTEILETRGHREQRWFSWRWAAPVAAGLAALVVWAVVRPAPPRMQTAPEPPSLSARAEPPAAPAPPPVQLDRTERQQPADRRAAAKPAPAPPADAKNRFAAAPQRPGTRADAAANAPTASKRAADSLNAAAQAPAAPSMRALAETVAVASADIVSSDPAVRWRLRGTSVERTTDAGATWVTEDTGVASPLAAGSSPSPNVCWIVGAAGTVLRSVDGRTWQRIRFPEAVDLVAVQAASAASATVTTADARRFTTADAGATWEPGPLQEF